MNRRMLLLGLLSLAAMARRSSTAPVDRGLQGGPKNAGWGNSNVNAGKAYGGGGQSYDVPKYSGKRMRENYGIKPGGGFQSYPSRGNPGRTEMGKQGDNGCQGGGCQNGPI